MQDILQIGGGYLGGRLAKTLAASARVDVVTRTLNRKGYLEEAGCHHYALDVRSTTFRLPAPPYDTVIFCPAVGDTDRRQENALWRLYCLGLRNVYQELSRTGFKGKLLIVGSTSAVAPADGLPEEHIIEEKDLETQQPLDNASYQQYQVWKQNAFRNDFNSILLVSSGIYGPFRHPGNRIAKGLKELNQDPARFVNLIHVSDLALAAKHLLGTVSNSDLFLASDGHPLRLREYYDIGARLWGLQPPVFTPVSPPDAAIDVNAYRQRPSRILSNRKLLETGWRPYHLSFAQSFDSILKEERLEGRS